MIVHDRIYNVAYRYLTRFKKKEIENCSYSYEGQEANDAIYDLLNTRKPCMVSRFGMTELHGLTVNISRRFSFFLRVKNYIEGKEDFFLYKKRIFEDLRTLSGVFDINEKKLSDFTDIYINAIKNIDILGSWMKEEYFVKKFYSSNIKTVPLKNLEPFHFEKPWSRILKDKNVLVVHPFSESIQKQYKNHRLLFKDSNVLPDFNLITLKAVQSIAGSKVEYHSWVDALHEMEDKIANINFDIAIIGCGAYGMPLASFVKNLGKQSVHLGGSTQLLFGIRGKRWDEHADFQHLFNEYWCYPSKEETPVNANLVESSCYW